MAADYLTLADLQAVLGPAQVVKLLDHDKDGVPDAALVDAVLSEAETYVEGFVSRVYPMATMLASPTTRKKIVGYGARIAAEYAWHRRPEFATRDGSPNTPAYKETKDTLKLIGEGKFHLSVNNDPAQPANSGGGPRYGTVDNMPTTPPFTRNGTGLF